jgi:hypothetical protein
MIWQCKKTTDTIQLFVSTTENKNFCTEMTVYKEENQNSVDVVFAQASYPEAYHYFEHHQEFGFSERHGVFMTDLGYHCTLSVQHRTEKDVLLRYWLALETLDPTLSEIIPEVNRFLGYVSVKELYVRLFNTYQQEGFDTALAWAFEQQNLSG